MDIKTGFFCDKDDFSTELYELLLIFFEKSAVATKPIQPETFEEYECVLCANADFSEMYVKGMLYRRETVEKSSDISKVKNSVKRNLLNALAEYTGYYPPWGILTGVKPVKIATACLAGGMTAADAEDYIIAEYHTQKRKAELLCNIAENERNVLADTNDKMLSVYVGIPFCPTTCLYCSFSSYPVKRYKKELDTYIEAVISEFEASIKLLADKGYTVDTMYFGGGTPTSPAAEQIDRLLDGTMNIFEANSLKRPTEITFEAGRPDSLNERKLRMIKSYGIERIGINPQTMHDKTLKLIGRQHSAQDIEEAYRMARGCGITNINMDLIAGLPGETYEDFAYTLSKIKEMKPDGFTVHALAQKRAAAMTRDEAYACRPDFSIAEAMIELGHATAADMGMIPYYLYRQKSAAGNLENTGYSVPDKICRYNILITEEQQSILGIGAGAMSKAVITKENRIEREYNYKDPLMYIRDIEQQIVKKLDFLRELY